MTIVGDSRAAEPSLAALQASGVTECLDSISVSLCGLCGRSTSRVVCPGCELQVRELMSELEQVTDHLSEFYLVMPKTGDGGGGPRGKPSSKPPLSIAVLSLLGPDCKTDHSPHGPIEDQSGNRSVLSVLANWARDWYSIMPSHSPESGQIGCPPPVTHSIRSVLSFLSVHNSWAIDNYSGYLDFCADLRSLISACQRITEKTPAPVFIGLCPTETESGFCSAKLYVTAGAREIKCNRCTDEWPKYQWRSLGAAISRADAVGRSVPTDVTLEG